MDVSIITPSFRQVPYLRLCAASVADQSGDFTHEHLIQDGGSGTELEDWAASQPSIDLRQEPDGGMYDAINRGFLRSKGRILAWLNCDEQYLPDALAVVVRWFADHPQHDILFGDVIIVSPDGEPLSYRQALLPIKAHIRTCFLPTYSAATFVRRRVVEQGHLLDVRYRAIADAVWIHTLLAAGFKAGVLNEPLAIFTQTGENLGQTPLAVAESASWRNPAPLRRLFWSIIHRLRKSLCGAYRKRELHFAMHLSDGTGRESRTGMVGGCWETKR